MLKSHDSVSSGKDGCCQSSHQGKISKRQIVQSLQNMNRAFKFADVCDDTKRVIRRLSKTVREGGLHYVGPFYAQMLINLATKLGLITNQVHIENVMVAPSTNTFKRLKDLYNVKTTAHAAEIIPFLVNRTGRKAVWCENRLCEVLRANKNIVDVFFEGDMLYKVDRGQVYEVSSSGARCAVRYQASTFGVKYKPPICWWDSTFMFGKSAHVWDNDLISLTKTVKRRGKRKRNYGLVTERGKRSRDGGVAIGNVACV